MKTLLQTLFLLISLNIFSQNKEIPVAINKEDGFYSVLNFEKENYKLEDLKLSLKPEVSINEILEIKKIKDELDRNVIDITLTKEGAKKFEIVSKNNIGKPIAIVL